MADATEVLRQFCIDGKEPEIRGDLVYFGDVSYPKNTKTRIGTAQAGEFYQLDQLAWFLKVRNEPVASYVKSFRFAFLFLRLFSIFYALLVFILLYDAGRLKSSKYNWLIVNSC